MSVNERIALRRKELGLTDVETARRCGLSISAYDDIERYAEEIFELVPLHSVKRLCDVLQVDFFDLLEIPCAFCEGGKSFVEEYRLPRSEVIRKRREAKGWSADELGDRVGFYEVEIHKLEQEPGHLESWRLDSIKELATEIEVPLQVLLGVKCRKCGR